MNTDTEILNPFQALWADIRNEETFPAQRPLLAHYTSIKNLVSIMTDDQIWFSNPLFMNDYEELRFGVLEGAQAFRKHETIKTACGTPERYVALRNAFDYHLDLFSKEHALDVYVFCLSLHDPENTDGLLSMWRGYGGNGNGAAIIFDTAQVNYVATAPLILSRVEYKSQEARLNWIEQKLNIFAELLRTTDIPSDNLNWAAGQLFERIKIFALLTKHHGFKEEKEWRAIYLKERDNGRILVDMLDYAVGRNGIEPKLKYKIKPIAGFTMEDLSMEKIVHQIILGPSVSNPIAQNAVKRMLEKNGKPNLATKLIASTTPFRSL